MHPSFNLLNARCVTCLNTLRDLGVGEVVGGRVCVWPKRQRCAKYLNQLVYPTAEILRNSLEGP